MLLRRGPGHGQSLKLCPVPGKGCPSTWCPMVAHWGTWLCGTWEVTFLSRFLDQLFGGAESCMGSEDAEV